MSGKALLSQLKSELAKSPLASNVLFGVVLTVLEKFVEMEFVCPCNSENCTAFAVGIFIVPPVLVLLLMLNIQGKEEKTGSEWEKKLLYGLGIVLVWIILLSLDGRYWVCYKTDWSGKFVIVPDGAPKKWCKPTNSSSSSGDELKKTLKWYCHSQVFGMVVVIIITLVLAGYEFLCNKKQQKTENSPGQDHQDPEASVNKDATQSARGKSQVK